MGALKTGFHIESPAPIQIPTNLVMKVWIRASGTSMLPSMDLIHFLRDLDVTQNQVQLTW